MRVTKAASVPRLRGLSAARPPAVLMGDLTLVRPLAMAGVPVYVATADEGDLAARSRHVRGALRLPPGRGAGGAARVAAGLSEIGAELHRALGRRVPLYYGTDAQLELIYAHREALSEHYLLLLNDERLCWELCDKQQFYELAARVGLRAPRTLDSGRAIERGLAALREPLLVKPKRKSDWRGIQQKLFEGAAKARVFPTREALLGHPAFAALRDEIVVQECVGGAVTDLYSFHGYADAGGRLLAWFCGRKIRTYPSFAGESSFVELTLDPVAEQAGRDAAARLGLVGPFKIDLIREAGTGVFYTLEVNARFNLWHYVGAAHGVNLPAVAYEYLVLGRAPEGPPRYVPRHRWVNFYRDLQAFREQRARGEATLAGWAASLARGPLLCETFALDDPMPFAHWAARFARGWVRS